MSPRTLVAAGASLLLLGTLSACASDSTDTAAESSAAPAACPIEVADPWVKASDSGMTAGFAVLTNTGTADVTISAASSPAAPRMELHEVVDKDGAMVMQPVAGGLAVPAGGSLTLAPGGYHMMFMDISDPIEPGEEIAITLTCQAGGTVAFTAPAKVFEGAAENYVGTSGGMDMSASPSES